MTRKLERLDHGTLDRISGGCRPVAVESSNPTVRKLRGLGAELISNLGMSDMTTLPASLADLRDVAPTAIHDFIPDVTTVGTAQVLNDELDDMLDMQTADGNDDSINTLPPMWCGTGSTGAWDDAENEDSPEPNGAGADAEAADDSWQPSVPMLVLDEPVETPTVRDHRSAAIAELADVGEPIINDHRNATDTGASDAGPIIRDHR